MERRKRFRQKVFELLVGRVLVSRIRKNSIDAFIGQRELERD